MPTFDEKYEWCTPLSVRESTPKLVQDAIAVLYRGALAGRLLSIPVVKRATGEVIWVLARLETTPGGIQFSILAELFTATEQLTEWLNTLDPCCAHQDAVRDTRISDPLTDQFGPPMVYGNDTP